MTNPRAKAKPRPRPKTVPGDGSSPSATSGCQARPCSRKLSCLRGFDKFTEATWRVGGLSKEVVSRLISTLKGTLIGVMVLISP